MLQIQSGSPIRDSLFARNIVHLPFSVEKRESKVLLLLSLVYYSSDPPLKMTSVPLMTTTTSKNISDNSFIRYSVVNVTAVYTPDLPKNAL